MASLKLHQSFKLKPISRKQNLSSESYPILIESTGFCKFSYYLLSCSRGFSGMILSLITRDLPLNFIAPYFLFSSLQVFPFSFFAIGIVALFLRAKLIGTVRFKLESEKP